MFRGESLRRPAFFTRARAGKSPDFPRREQIMMFSEKFRMALVRHDLRVVFGNSVNSGRNGVMRYVLMIYRM